MRKTSDSMNLYTVASILIAATSAIRVALTWLFCLCRWQHLARTLSFHQPVNTHVCNVVAASQDYTSCGYTRPHTGATTLSGVRFVEKAVWIQVILGDTCRHTQTKLSINALFVICHSATNQAWKDTSNIATMTFHWNRTTIQLCSRSEAIDASHRTVFLCRLRRFVAQTMSSRHLVTTHVCTAARSLQGYSSYTSTKLHTEATTLTGVRFVRRGILLSWVT